jgi:hypothetical protein
MKTPKEKAEELFMMYVNKGMIQIKPVINRFIRKEMTKQCALIAVDEILDLGLLYGDAPFGNGGKQFHSYWLEVKREIEKL